jgi:Tfp pilus assembly protein PilF
MRYGQRASDEIDKAIALDPKNASAYVSKSISLYYTPDSFGGSKTKALEMMKKAVEADPTEDSAHIWLAIFHLDAGRKKEAMDEILLAKKIDPDRAFTNFVLDRVKATK